MSGTAAASAAPNRRNVREFTCNTSRSRSSNALYKPPSAIPAAAITALALRVRSRRNAWLALSLSALVVGIWYQTIQPRQDRIWTADVAHSVTADINDDQITLHNVRDFNWTTDTVATPVWEDRTYNLADLTSTDMITSVWDDPKIAHLIVSFGFADNRHIAFSVEIRKEQGESFSTVGGFFRQFELVLIAADENDIVRVRTNLRKEDVHLFPVKLNEAQRRTLFLSYLGLGNDLAKTPEFYNTVTANCTSAVYRLVQVIKPDLPLDYRLLYSGLLPEYIDELHGLPGDMPMAQRRLAAAITAKAQSIMPGQDYSALIRTN